MSNTISSAQLMMQMGQMKSLASSRTAIDPSLMAIQQNKNGIEGVDASEKVNFTDVLGSALKQVNSIQQEAGQLKKDFEMGKEGVDLVQVMVASEKSSVAFTAMLEIRNKLMKTYNEVKNIRV